MTSCTEGAAWGRRREGGHQKTGPGRVEGRERRRRCWPQGAAHDPSLGRHLYRSACAASGGGWQKLGRSQCQRGLVPIFMLGSSWGKGVSD